ncbi:MAG: hypothetical protein ACHQET_13025 [Chitinophagales bacterium]
MKNRLIGLLMMITMSAAAQIDSGKNPITDKMMQSLQKEFSNATGISWAGDKENGLVHARFLYNDEPVEAFFGEDGNLVSVARFITERQLPIMIMKEMLTNYPQYKIREALEFTNENETSYVVSASSEKETVILKFSPNGECSRIKRIKHG